MKKIAVFGMLVAVLSSHAADPYITLDGAGSDVLLNSVQVRAKRALSGTNIIALGYADDLQAQAALNHGDCLVWIEVEVENLRVPDELLVLPSAFRLITFDNISHSYESSQREINANIRRGEIAKGGLLFSVPTNSTPSTLRFQPGIVLHSPDYTDAELSVTIPVTLRWDGTDFIKDQAYWREKWYEINPQWRPRTKARSASESEGKAEAAAVLKKRQMQKSLLAWQSQQASNGVARSQYQLGLRYLTGDGVESNRLEAIHWIGAAAAQDHAEAKEFIRTNLVARPKPLDVKNRSEGQKEVGP
jgi:hypothetical protein